ncbi:PAS/PAC sensor(s)-containing diguanylate cyclase/phosphodiesterase [Caballeronia pedi]|uniref:PAS/PAC sensor(S)-containing diguanylate cyclase/phosphodiesterase n=1 Tax=Caballeronia pedi TaxID=1777141 RepID=A0A158DEK6_9BURK|nr:GGDEF domain-containing protein [Caballeronia pedi]SAK92913.1 PAS/PAC sensor(s)-containing diguanylate cyclase/phosphodiesterase [Caballeronia pedi]
MRNFETEAHSTIAAGSFIDSFDQTTSLHLAEAIIDSSEDAIVAKTLDGIIRTWNNGARAIFGYEQDEIVGRPVLVLIPPDRLEEEHMILARVIRGERIDHFDTTRIRKDGGKVDVSVTVSPVRNGEGAIIGASKIARDITFQKLAHKRLLKASNVFTYSSEAIAITDHQGRIVEVNDAFCSTTGFARNEALGCSFESFLKSEDGIAEFSAILLSGTTEHLRIESTGRKKHGDSFVALVTVTAVKANEAMIESFIFLIADVTELREKQKQLEAAAYRDALTGLPNRRSLVTKLEAFIEQCVRTNETFALAFIDLDGFKLINDTQGHDTGDRFLAAIGERLSQSLREGDFLARIGGDEFIAILPGVQSAEHCRGIVERLLSACSRPILLDRIELTTSCSIGVSFLMDRPTSPVAMLNAADRAMYEAKQYGKNQVCFSAESLSSETTTFILP